MKQRSILLSFDVEEFDMPLEYHQSITLNEQLSIGAAGVAAILPVLQHPNLRATLFTTATYAIHHPEQMASLALQHEIASHTYYHSQFEEAHLLQSKNVLASICKTNITGLRMPRMRAVSMEAVGKAGYLYDSSINPTYIPGRYNNLRLPRTHYSEEGVTRIPSSVSPMLRFPLFWLAFKNLPYSVYKHLALQTLKKDGYICLYFHPWEFTDAIQNTALPTYTKRWCGPLLVERLWKLVKDLEKEGDYITMQQHYEHSIKTKHVVC